MGELMAAKIPEESVLLQQIFSEADVQRLGYLQVPQVAELARGPAMTRFLAGQSPEALLRQLDVDGDGRVTFEDFRLAVQGRGRRGGHRHHHGGAGDFRVGQVARFWSRSHSAWVECAVTAVDEARGAVQVDCKPGHWLEGEELHHHLKAAHAHRLQEPEYRKGQEVLLYSTTFSTWIPCRVLEVDAATGAVQVDQKPHYWFKNNELRTRIRPAGVQDPGRGALRAAAGRHLLAGAMDHA